LYFGAAVYAVESVSDMFTCQVNHHDHVNPCGQALDKRMGGPRSPQWELKTRIQILHHVFYWQGCHGSITVGNIIATTTVCYDCISPKAPSPLLLWHRLYAMYTSVKSVL